MTKDAAKVAFLKIMYRWPTFGSSFFEVAVSIVISLGSGIFHTMAVFLRGYVNYGGSVTDFKGLSGSKDTCLVGPIYAYIVLSKCRIMKKD